VGEHRASGERTSYLSNLPAEADLEPLAAAIKARWSGEQAHPQMKAELGLDHFEGRSWRGLHRHALMTLIAMAFLQPRRLAQAKRGQKERPLATPSAKPARRPAGHPRDLHATPAAPPMSPLPTMDPTAA